MTRARIVLITRILLVIGACAVLEVMCRTGFIDRRAVIPPSEMVASMTELLFSGQITDDLARTVATVGTAFIGAVALGFLAGVGIHATPRLRRAIDPLLAAYYAIPGFIFYPVLVALFGLNVLPLMMIGLLFAAPAMVVATLLGLDQVPVVLRKSARIFRLNRTEAIRHVILPAAMPSLFNGVRLAFAYAFIGVIAGEFILSSGGLGFGISDAYEGFETRRMYGLLLLVLLLAVVFNGVFYTWEMQLLRRRQRG